MRVREVTRPALSPWAVPVVAVAVLGATAAVLVVLWRWIDGLSPADAGRAGAQLDAVKIAVSTAVGAGGLFALYLAARRQRTQELELEVRRAELAQRDRVQAHAEQVAEHNRLHAERVAADARVDAEARRVTELYAKSVEQLGSDKAPIRLGGLYALERLAQDNPRHRQTVVDVVCAYLRMAHPLPDDPAGGDGTAHQELQVRLAAQNILSTHLRPAGVLGGSDETFWPDIDLHLSGATLVGLDLAGCQVRTANFTRTRFRGHTLFLRSRISDYAWFVGARFEQYADFNQVRFDGPAHFHEADFADYADFNTATFVKDAAFSAARFALNAGFAGASFGNGASFSGARFEMHAGFDQAVFAGHADFSGARFTETAVFNEANFKGATSFGGTVFGEYGSFAAVAFAQAVDLSAALCRGGAWPTGWREGADDVPVEGVEGVWHRLVREPALRHSGVPGVT